MKIINALVMLGIVSLVSACGGGGSSGSSSAPSSIQSSSVAEASSSVEASSSIEASSSVEASSSSEASSSIEASSSSETSSSIEASSSSEASSASEISSSSLASSSDSASLYPDYNTNPLAPDATGMDSTAVQIASRIQLGINLGNTMEAIGGETAWGNPLITEAQLAFLKDSGYDAIRLPVAWDQYANQETAEISAVWLDRVKQVVQYAVDNDLYVIVNIHWDGGWLENNVTPDKQEANNAKQKAFWEQIATHLRDFDERLLFAGTNEPNAHDEEQMAVLDTYHQTFVDAVRSTGGKNANRVLVLQGPATDITETDKLWNDMPTDSVVDKLMMEVHFYSPFNFAIMDQDEEWGNQFYYWGEGFHSTTDTAHNPTWGEEAFVDEVFTKMKTKFVDQGIPVVLGEFGAMRRDNLTGDDLALHLASRAYYYRYVTERANTTGLLPFVWDTGGLFHRNTLAILDQQVWEALLLGAGKASSSSSSSDSSSSSSAASSVDASSSSSSVEASSSSSSSSSSEAASSESNLLTFDMNSSNWEPSGGAVMDQSGSDIALTLSAANQAVFYNIDGPINLIGATFTVVFNFDSDYVAAVSAGTQSGILQFVAFERTGWTSEYICWSGWRTIVAGQDAGFSCDGFTKNNPEPAGARIGVQFFGNTGTVTIKNATLELAE